MSSFSELGLSAPLMIALERLGFAEPTPIQAATIPKALAGQDILGTAQTGTGKTAAFGLPLIEHVAAMPKRRRALVLTPTRELATQVLKVLEGFLDPRRKIGTALLIGGESYGRQHQALARSPSILVGTPGRLNDHVNQGTLKLRNVSYLVLDETDRMLDMGFAGQIDALLQAISPPPPSDESAGRKTRSSSSEAVEHTKHLRQTLMFSATLPAKIERLAKTYLTDPARVCIGAPSRPQQQLAQRTLFLPQPEKLAALKDILESHQGSALVFVRTKYGTERLAKTLVNQGLKADALHGGLRQSKRAQIVANFRKAKFRILVATDVAARGLDIPKIALVINHDLPQVAEDYVHRIGRTARAGAKGLAFSFISPAEKPLWVAITRLLNPSTAEPDLAAPARRRRHAKKWTPLASRPRAKPSKAHTSLHNTQSKTAKSDQARRPKTKKRARDATARKEKGKPTWAARGKQVRTKSSDEPNTE